MFKYLYIYNYSPNEQDLCEMEFRRIFHEKMTSKFYLSNHDFDYTRSVFIKGRLDIIRSSVDFDEIVHFIEEEKMCYYDFKVIYLKNDITHVHYQESIDKCKRIAFPIAGSVNMQKPKVIFAITQIDNVWYFGIYHDDVVWSQHYEKPHSYSHSLNIRDARTIVNIAIGNETQQRVIDPCCGVGTVVLEALSMGIDIEGYDINRDVSYQARLNLEHYGYDPLLIQKRDMRMLDKIYDVVIMDIPYGVYSPFTHSQQRELIHAASQLAPCLLLVSHIQMNRDLMNEGYHIVDQARIQKGNFERYMTLCELGGERK